MKPEQSDSDRRNMARTVSDEGFATTADHAAGPVAGFLALAARQHGVVTGRQLMRAGSTRYAIGHYLKTGWLEPMHRGVYGVGPVMAPHRREMAALLACGPGAVLSHRSAAALWEMLPAPPVMVPVTLSTTRDLRGRTSGIRVYRVRGLDADEVSVVRGLRVTHAARTLLDLAASLSVRDLERAMARADRKGFLDRRCLELLLTRYPRRPGRTRLAALLEGDAGPTLTRSEAEERFLALIRRAGLRDPEMNVVVQDYEVDALWRAERLVVEIDGFAFHSTRAVFERDRQRDRELTAAGLTVLRITWRELTLQPEALLVQLAQALANRGAL
jgi:very-short-patch-repair endonuclease